MTMISSRIFLLSAALLWGTAAAQFSEHKVYSDDACTDLEVTWAVNGAVGSSGSGLEAFGVCNNLTGSSDDYSSSMYECADNEVTASYFADSSCSGTAALTNQITSSTCSDGEISRCTEDSEWNVVTDWVVNVTYYSDADCSMATGVATLYTMAEAQNLAGDACASAGASTSGSSTLNKAIGCVNGENGRGLEAFGVCNGLTGSSDDYSSSMYECTDNEVTVSYYADSSCTGTTVWTNQTTSNTCNFGVISRCTEDSEWSVVTDWVVNVTFYSDVNCSMATGVTTLYTMAEAQDLAGDACAPAESTTSESSTFNEATGCVDGEVHAFLYAESDTTCSSEFVLIFMEATDSCTLSIADDGPYMSTACSASDDDSDEDSPESDGASSLVAIRSGSSGWSIVAAAIAIALVTTFG